MSETTSPPIALTEYAHGAGCGCKIAPQVLQEILKSKAPAFETKNLLVGNSSNDDAAVYDLGNGKALISTTDFFMPIVDDAYDFGRVAAANAISDVYAMGGSPLLALAILGWPVTKLPVDLAQKVMEGARSICLQAGIPLAGGHSIDTLEPMFGLSVNGMIDNAHIKRNDTAQEGDLIFLTKPIGVGILSTAQKRKLLRDEDKSVLINQLVQLNNVGEKLGKIKNVSAMTDVTGFGLLGHVLEMCGSSLTASLRYDDIPKLGSLPFYIAQTLIPDATYRNWNAYQDMVYFDQGIDMAEAFALLPDPQTNGGLLFTVNKNGVEEVSALLKENGLNDLLVPIGIMLKRGEKPLRIES